jgi:hypothetical protein
MKSKKVYHSALNNPIEDLPPTDRFELNGNVAIYHNIVSGDLPPEFKRCDVIYSEVAWMAGLEIFNARAGETSNYTQYLEAINNIIVNAHCPVVIICGKSFAGKLVKPTQAIPTTINGAPALAHLYGNFPPTIEGKTSYDIIERLAQVYNHVGDFCCGYGNTGKIFTDKGKSFTQSDYDKKCITYIKNHYENLH